MMFNPFRPDDTSIEAQAVQDQIWRRMGPQGRCRVAAQMSDDTRQISLDGIHARHPEYTVDEARHALFRLTLGDELYAAAWPDRPTLAP